MVSLTCLLDRTSLMSLLFLPLLDETKMAHNNSVFVFVRKTSNDSCGRPNLRIDMNQVTNLKSLGFASKNIINILEVTTHFWSLYFWNRSFCGRRCCKTSICISCCWSRWFTCTNLWSSLLSSPLPSPLVLGNSLSNSFWISFHPSALLPC